MSFTCFSDLVAIDSCKSFWDLHGFSERSSPEEEEELESESAGPLCLRIAHTHPSGVSAELTALSTVWGALCVSLHCLLA